MREIRLGRKPIRLLEGLSGMESFRVRYERVFWLMMLVSLVFDSSHLRNPRAQANFTMKLLESAVCTVTLV